MSDASNCPSFEMDNHSSGVIMESLLPEIRRHLLSVMPLECLKTLLLASPVYYQQYCADRKYILNGSLEATLGSVTYDACAVYRTGAINFLNSRTRNSVALFVEAYEKGRTEEYSIFDEALSIQDLKRIVRFYLSVIEPLVQHFAEWAQSCLPLKMRLKRFGESLTSSEKVRIARAFYRLELSCNLFGIGRKHTNRPRPSRLRSNELWTTRHVLSTIQPWEIEEVHAIFEFAKSKYEPVLTEIVSDLDEKPLNISRTSGPEDRLRVMFHYEKDEVVERAVSCGLELLHGVTVKGHVHKDALIATTHGFPTRFIRLLGSAAHVSDEFSRFHAGYLERKRKHRQGDPMPFQGDVVTMDLNGNYPPFAWTLLWQEQFSNLCAWSWQKRFRAWGYVMWDMKRVKSTEAESVVRKASMDPTNFGKDMPDMEVLRNIVWVSVPVFVNTG